MAKTEPMPSAGGSYVRGEDGSLERVAFTKPRPTTEQQPAPRPAASKEPSTKTQTAVRKGKGNA